MMGRKMSSEISGRIGVPEDQQPIVLPAAFEAKQAVAPDEDTARWLRRHYAAGVTVVTTIHDGDFYGLTVSAFSFVSLDPLLVFIALGSESQTGEHIRASGVFGVSLLTYLQQFLADRFAGRAPLVDRHFEGVPYTTAVTGSPLLTESIAWLDCELRQWYDGGDHIIYIGEAVAVAQGSGSAEDPLLYFDSRYRRLR
jgi:flavin reductase (DIM6/NTAB) family NADH-FMN oxidoreductase RutF